MPRKAQSTPEQEEKKEAVNAPADAEKGQKKGTGATPEQEEKKEAVKVYNFTSKNSFLSCVALGVQFVNGKASTTNLEVAKALATIDGVELVEE